MALVAPNTPDQMHHQMRYIEQSHQTDSQYVFSYPGQLDVKQATQEADDLATQAAALAEKVKAAMEKKPPSKDPTQVVGVVCLGGDGTHLVWATIKVIVDQHNHALQTQLIAPILPPTGGVSKAPPDSSCLETLREGFFGALSSHFAKDAKSPWNTDNNKFNFDKTAAVTVHEMSEHQGINIEDSGFIALKAVETMCPVATQAPMIKRTEFIAAAKVELDRGLVAGSLAARIQRRANLPKADIQASAVATGIIEMLRVFQTEMAKTPKNSKEAQQQAKRLQEILEHDLPSKLTAFGKLALTTAQITQIHHKIEVMQQSGAGGRIEKVLPAPPAALSATPTTQWQEMLTGIQQQANKALADKWHEAAIGGDLRLTVDELKSAAAKATSPGAKPRGADSFPEPAAVAARIKGYQRFMEGTLAQLKVPGVTPAGEDYKFDATKSNLGLPTVAAAKASNPYVAPPPPALAPGVAAPPAAPAPTAPVLPDETQVTADIPAVQLGLAANLRINLGDVLLDRDRLNAEQKYWDETQVYNQYQVDKAAYDFAYQEEEKLLKTAAPPASPATPVTDAHVKAALKAKYVAAHGAQVTLLTTAANANPLDPLHGLLATDAAVVAAAHAAVIAAAAPGTIYPKGEPPTVVAAPAALPPASRSLAETMGVLAEMLPAQLSQARLMAPSSLLSRIGKVITDATDPAKAVAVGDRESWPLVHLDNAEAGTLATMFEPLLPENMVEIRRILGAPASSSPPVVGTLFALLHNQLKIDPAELAALSDASIRTRTQFAIKLEAIIKNRVKVAVESLKPNSGNLLVKVGVPPTSLDEFKALPSTANKLQTAFETTYQDRRVIDSSSDRWRTFFQAGNFSRILSVHQSREEDSILMQQKNTEYYVLGNYGVLGANSTEAENDFKEYIHKVAWKPAVGALAGLVAPFTVARLCAAIEADAKVAVPPRSAAEVQAEFEKFANFVRSKGKEPGYIAGLAVPGRPKVERAFQAEREATRAHLLTATDKYRLILDLDIPNKLLKKIEAKIEELATKLSKANNLQEVKEIVDNWQIELDKFCGDLEKDIMKLHKEVAAKIPKATGPRGEVLYEKASRSAIDAAFQMLKQTVATARAEATQVGAAQYLKGRRLVMQDAGFTDKGLEATNAEIDALSNAVVGRLRSQATTAPNLGLAFESAAQDQLNDKYWALEHALTAAGSDPDQAIVSAHFNDQLAESRTHYQALLDPAAHQALLKKMESASARAAQAAITEWVAKPGASAGAPKDVAVLCKTTVERGMPGFRSNPVVTVTASVLTANSATISVSGADKFGVLSSKDKSVKERISETLDAVQSTAIEMNKRNKEMIGIYGSLPIDRCLETAKAALKTYVAVHGVDKSLLDIQPKELRVALLGRAYSPLPSIYDKYMDLYRESQRRQTVCMDRSVVAASQHSAPVNPDGHPALQTAERVFTAPASRGP